MFMDVMLQFFELVLGSLGAALSVAVEQGLGLLSLDAGGIRFAVQAKKCSVDSCPGSQFTSIAAAWANIGYVTHSDVLNYITTTKFGLWAPLIYVCAALAALVGVAINAPLRSYMWFFLGPAIYGFLVGTTMQVEGVNWVVANQPQDMSDVWRNAEVGLKNTDSVSERGVLTLNGKDGPVGAYTVAMPMVFLDELFSATTNILIEWLGIYRHDGDGSANSNLAARQGQKEGPWYLLSNLKWGMVENIVGVTARNPDFRDALVTFLASECGEKFKRGIDSGKYISAGSSHGQKKVSSVLVERNPNFVGPPTQSQMFEKFITPLDNSAIPTPRSVIHILQEGIEVGQFGGFAPLFGNKTMLQAGRYQGIVCSEYLYTIIQQIRFEAGHWYWQLVRSAPNGLTRQQFLNTLFYGWDIRRDESGQYADPPQMNAFVKHMIMTYLLRNELLFAPQITEVNQRFAPSEASRSYSEAHVRTMGSKSKSQELYNWAVLMPHMQGILVYFLVIAYPFAAMVMVLPGYYKTFLTWVAFFAWVKLWDVGFAIVMVLERSVWAMIGNSSNMARTANMLIREAEAVGGIGVSCSDNAGSSGSASRLSELCPVPNVCSLAGGSIDSEQCSTGSGQDQKQEHAWRLLDALLTLGAGADLDLANGYYIYIMAALYFAVPAVTGQLVLGAKAGASSMLNSAIGGVAGEAGKAASTGYQAQAVNTAQTNQGSLAQAAYGKAMRKEENGSSLASDILSANHQPLDEERNAADHSLKKARLGADASIAGENSRSYDRSAALAKQLGSLGTDGVKGVFQMRADMGNPNADGRSALQRFMGFADPKGSTGGGAGGGGESTPPYQKAGAAYLDIGGHEVAQNSYAASAKSAREGTLQDGLVSAANLRRSAASTYGGNMKGFGDYEAKSAVWEAKNQFASHVSAMAGIAGMNTGGLNPGAKPDDLTGMAMSGQLSSYRGQAGSGGARPRATLTVDSHGTGHGGARYTDSNGGGFLSEVTSLSNTHTEAMSPKKEVREFDRQNPGGVVVTAAQAPWENVQEFFSPEKK